MINVNNTKCMLCGNDNYKLVYNAQDEEHGIEGTFTYVRCKKCGLVYMNPQITNEKLAQYYPINYFPHKIVKNSPENKGKKSNSKLVTAIRKFFFQHDNISKVPSSIINNLNSESKVLDVGCGNGTFINDIRNKTQCHIDGIDFSETAVKSAKESYDLDIIKGTVEDLPFSPQSFDLITAWWFLVHVNNPNEVLQSIAKHLKDDGDCIIGVPNFNSFNARYFKEKWFHLDAPKHLCIHTPFTIKKMLENNGFYVEKIIYDNTPSGFFGSLNNFYKIKQDKLPSFLIKVLFVFIAITSWFKVSDLLIIHAKKIK